MKARTSWASTFLLLLLLVLPACDQPSSPTAKPAPSQGTATTQEIQATIEALQTIVATSTVVGQDSTTEVMSAPTPEATQEPEPAPTAEAGIASPIAEAQPTDAPVATAMLPTGQGASLAGHPRLLVRAEDLPRLRSWAVESNPFYKNGLLPVIEQAKADMDSGIILQQTDSADNGGTAYTEYPNEMFAELFAFASLISNDEAARKDYAQRARTLLMRIINESAKGYAEGQPFRDPAFPIKERSRWQGEAYGLTVDWIYPYLSAEDKATIRKVFLQWSNTIVTEGYHHPEPVGMVNNPQLLADNLAARWAVNNYFTGNMRNLGLMSMSFDPTDDPDGELGKYLDNAIGARLYMTDYMMRNDASGGLPAEGFEYGGAQNGYVLQFLYALHTAGQSDPARWGPQVSIDNPFWDNFVSGYLHSFSPAPLELPNQPELGQLFQAAYYGDGEKYLPTFDFMESFGPLALYARSTGNTEQVNKIRWIETNMAPGGAEKLMERAADSYSFFNSILYFMLFDPKAGQAADPHLLEPLNFYAPGMGHILSRTGWDEGSTWFNYMLGWTTIDHQQGDGNSFDFYRNGEWLTKERVGYELFTSDYHNTLALQNDIPGRLEPGNYLDIMSGRGSQWIYSGNQGKLVAHSFGQGFTYGLGDATGLYNSDYEGISDITHASRSIVWLQPDYIIVYDRASSKTAGRFKRFWLQTPTKAVVSGKQTTMTTERKQKLFVTTLLPQDATVTSEAVDTYGEENTAEEEPMKYRLRVEAPGGPQNVRFLNVLQGANAGATPSEAVLVDSTGGTPYAGTVVNGVAVMFPVDLQDEGREGNFSSLTYTIPSVVTAHLITGLAPNAGYDAEVTNAGASVQVRVTPGSKYKADEGGVLALGTLPGRP
ncbi:MAG: hypothetical protein ABIQ44_09640 [Chloroflexia bacterium]